MKCINCGAVITGADLEYCPRCGSNVMIQKKLDYLSKLYYNQGLEKASIRDLSGAISLLRQSLMFNKSNIAARNLLGLVYFETGEVVAALGEWVISENLSPHNNRASAYINKLRSNPGKLEAINETIKKYNHALIMCRQGHEDMAAIQLKKILTQNSKLIKGYHLLALIQMRNHEWHKARKTLRKAARIDKTNTTTLRFLREVDEQTGMTTKLDKEQKGLFRNEEEIFSEVDTAVQPQAYRERSRFPVFFTLFAGVAVGAVSFWLLVMPSIRRDIYMEANNQIVQYSESLASKSAELSKAMGEAEQSDNTLAEQAEQLVDAQARSTSYQALVNASLYWEKNVPDNAKLELQKVNIEHLTEDQLKLYDKLNTQVEEAIAKRQGTDSGKTGSEYTGYYYNYSSYSYGNADYYDSY
ncbi:MAG: hypothetical protein HUJ72_00860 [Blautia sp.]|nr:hypothetical protein [Blautia sp.]